MFNVVDTQDDLDENFNPMKFYKINVKNEGFKGEIYVFKKFNNDEIFLHFWSGNFFNEYKNYENYMDFFQDKADEIKKSITSFENTIN